MNAAIQKPGKLITIGELAKRTGITTHTLRIWEKRHGAPKAIRLPSGHRRYPLEDVERLKTVAQALKLGFRAGKVVGRPSERVLIGVVYQQRLQRRKVRQVQEYARWDGDSAPHVLVPGLGE